MYSRLAEESYLKYLRGPIRLPITELKLGNKYHLEKAVSYYSQSPDLSKFFKLAKCYDDLSLFENTEIYLRRATDYYNLSKQNGHIKAIGKLADVKAKLYTNIDNVDEALSALSNSKNIIRYQEIMSLYLEGAIKGDCCALMKFLLFGEDFIDNKNERLKLPNLKRDANHGLMPCYIEYASSGCHIAKYVVIRRKFKMIRYHFDKKVKCLKYNNIMLEYENLLENIKGNNEITRLVLFELYTLLEHCMMLKSWMMIPSNIVVQKKQHNDVVNILDMLYSNDIYNASSRYRVLIDNTIGILPYVPTTLIQIIKSQDNELYDLLQTELRGLPLTLVKCIWSYGIHINYRRSTLLTYII